ncbi:ABC transporter permease [Ensifer aridi]|uniref:ABC transporter permease n=1 Tax=Ensifer aridi TaxID=1708715 RepID=UPI000A0FBC92|nr:ABC transporter permease [Ensifer aridi]
MTLMDWLLTEAPQTRRQAHVSYIARNLKGFLSHAYVLFGLAVIVPIACLSLAAPFFAPYDPFAQNLHERLLSPSGAHLFGTDHLGRDIFSRALYGGRITMAIVIAAAASIVPIGLAIGIVAGLRGGLIEVILVRVTDIFMSFPQLVLALALAAALGAGAVNAVVAIALTAWPPFARLARAETKRIKDADFVAARKLQGASTLRIALQDILPLVFPTILTRLTGDLAGMILTAASLGFLGLGAQPPMAEWGAMVADGRDFLMEQWWVATLPGALIFLVSFAINLFGDGIGEVMDPKQS